MQSIKEMERTNMYLRRRIDEDLQEWKNTPNHKPLLLRGARQVGKSSSVRHLGESFKYYVEVNFESRPEVMTLFKETKNVKDISQRLGKLYNTPIIPGETLLFLDEIQACEDALKCLWFFKEDFPELHVIAAGSLLEFTLKDIHAYGVGRIRSLFMYPLSFEEFLIALNKDTWVNSIREANCESPIFEALHIELVQAFRTFLIVGGMPASVAAWATYHDYRICADEQDDIQQTYYDDFAKYSKRISPTLLRATLQSAAMQVGKKFVYSHVEGGFKTNEVKNALQMLCDAGILKRVCHTAANGIPLGAESNNRYNKYIFLDSGLLLRILDLELGGAKEVTELILIGAAEDLVNKGDITEMVAGWEILKAGSHKTQHDLYYWENTDKGTSSEVDYIISKNLQVLPIEVKAGTSGKMKSLRLFMEKKGITNAIRTSLENFGRIEQTDTNDSTILRTIDIYPLYAIANIMM